MIPKKIHYCWFGGAEKDGKSRLCIESWKKILTDYEIVEWNESNFDVHINQFVSEAYAAKKWAFVADFARLWVLREHGGIYLDADVEVVKPFDDLLSLPAFTCYESTEHDGKPQIEAGVIGSEARGRWITDMAEIFTGERFIIRDEDGTEKQNLKILPERLIERTVANFDFTPVDNLTTVASRDVTVFEYHYFSPKLPKEDVIEQTNHTYAIHHFNNSWVSPYAYQKLRWKYYRKFGKKWGIILFVVAHPFKAIRARRFSKHGK